MLELAKGRWPTVGHCPIPGPPMDSMSLGIASIQAMAKACRRGCVALSRRIEKTRKGCALKVHLEVEGCVAYLTR